MSVQHAFLRPLGWAVASGFAALLLWANWQAPALHGYARPVTVAVLRIEGLRSGSEALALERQITAVPGVTACSIQQPAGKANLVYHPDETSVAAIQAAFARYGIPHPTQLHYSPPVPAPGTGCPVPSTYVVALDQLRFALNIRRFWIDA